MPARRLELTYKDEHGRDARHTLRIGESVDVSGGPLADALTGLQFLSNSGLYSVEAATPSSYSDSSDATSSGVPCTIYCVLFFSVPGSSPEISCSFAFPSPIESLFLPSGLIDPDSSSLAAVVAAIQACAVSPDGLAYGDLLFGYRSTNREGM